MTHETVAHWKIFLPTIALELWHHVNRELAQHQPTLVTFTRSEPQLWIVVIESNFKIADITDEAEKSSYTIFGWT